MYIITAKRITSGELLKYRNKFFIHRRYGATQRGSSHFALTLPGQALDLQRHRPLGD